MTPVGSSRRDAPEARTKGGAGVESRAESSEEARCQRRSAMRDDLLFLYAFVQNA